MATDEKKLVEGRVTLLGVRLSFADIWRPKSIKRKDGTESPPKFSANGLISKNGKDDQGNPIMAKYMGKKMPVMAALKKAKTDALTKKLGADKAEKAKVKPENYCVRDGDLENWDGYEGNFYISANNSKQPKIVGRDKRPMTERDGKPYSGCYVNMIVSLWCQTPGQTPNGDPKPLGVFGSLEAIQFVRDGEAFGAQPVDTDEEFDDITDGEDDDFGGDGDEDEDDVL